MIGKKKIVTAILCFVGVIAQAQILKPIDFSDISVEGELGIRTHKNLDRLQSDIYTPEKVFPGREENTEGWPGDYEGRVLMGLILEAQATHRNPKYLDEMLKMLPEKVNKNGYFGSLQGNVIREQQLSGNSWVLRTLCEDYYWTKDEKLKTYISRIINNLALPTTGYHKVYPIDPAQREKSKGGLIGNDGKTLGKWEISSDIGTDFVFLDAIVQAYGIIPSSELKMLIDEMVTRYLQMDLMSIKVQAHAGLTGLRGIFRYYTITKQPYLLEAVKDRYELYRSTSMTANFENFNWFGRPEWSEPCAIVDSYLLAVQLWQYTNNPFYLEDAQHIYYNAISNTQRANGGFSISNCPRPNYNSLHVISNEAWWCCTMRGAEGLARAVQYNYFIGAKEIVVPSFNTNEAIFHFKKQMVKIKEVSSYPFEGKVSFEVLNSTFNSALIFKLFAPSWTIDHKLLINGVYVPFIKENGFIIFKTKLVKGNKIMLTFEQQTKAELMPNKAYAKPDFYTLNYGPLVLGLENTSNKKDIAFSEEPKLVRLSERDWKIEGKDIHLTSVYHLLDPNVTHESGYSKQVLFQIRGSK